MLRRIEAVDGPTRVRVLLDPRAGYGRHRLTRLRRREGTWYGRCGSLYVRWSGAAEATEAADGGLEMVIDVDGGRHHDLVLEISRDPLRGDPPSAEPLWQATVRAWSETVPAISGTIADRDARQAFAVLRGMTCRTAGWWPRPRPACPSAPRRAQLRLPVRLDPRPVLRGAGRRRAGGARR